MPPRPPYSAVRVLIRVGRSFINVEKRIGFRIEPCGTPVVDMSWFWQYIVYRDNWQTAHILCGQHNMVGIVKNLKPISMKTAMVRNRPVVNAPCENKWLHLASQGLPNVKSTKITRRESSFSVSKMPQKYICSGCRKQRSEQNFPALC